MIAMKHIKFNYFKNLGLALLTLGLIMGCERELSDDAVLATFSNTAEIFTDAPVGLTDDFFVSFDPVEGANTEGFDTDDNVAYQGTSSIRIDVPTPTDPNGGFIGGIFRDRGEGRDLTGYDALTFWAKGSTTATVGLFGFGTDFEEDKYAVSIENVELSTDWRKITIPIPDASKLTQEKGMFIFSAGTESTSGAGYTFWMDEIKFEKLGTIRLQNPFIFSGQDLEIEAFIGANQRLTDLGAVFNLANGQNQSMSVAPSYFDFESTNSAVTGAFSLNSSGQAFTSIVGTTGTAVITAQLANVLAVGSLTINAAGAFPHAPVPMRAVANVTSIFSDAYANVPVRHYNGFFAPFQTTQGGSGMDPNDGDIQAPFVNGSVDNIINYTVLNFVSIGMYETVPNIDVSQRTHLHLDINVRENIDASDFIRIQLESGTGGASITSGTFVLSSLLLRNVDANGWASLDIPLSNFGGFTDPSNLGQLFFISDGTISDIWVDNIYFYHP
jgi:hypothetical protein